MWNSVSLCPFFTSRKSHPDLQEELGELRKHLLESTNDMTPLKVWELQGGQAAVIDGPLLQCSGFGAASPSEIKPILMVPGGNCPLDGLGSSGKVAVCTLCLLQWSVLFLFRLLNRCSCSQPSSILHCETWINKSRFSFVLIDKWSNLFYLTWRALMMVIMMVIETVIWFCYNFVELNVVITSMWNF